eukprot:CAMPEP_0195142720 /NCGR_PEP_ID=MMETSP0448-20130528/165104_1 /TAXON_ID=66468 /ORGANISM="Heterocapsa triquestra, Strain CCMP 448" /LENGTH=71 /DNA_ID=CAMNT_0040181127 /DNA_START=27 /DNA_END=239 /DNA_ORIENTATION=+
MSPERVLGKPYKYDSDLWSLGLLVLECITGCYPYLSREEQANKRQLCLWELMRRVDEQEPPQLPPGPQHPE